ncbi:hypothetical protein V5O48_018840 [Marasmius crinis-equi]|uniref:AAA-ATPase-like domain-containing protein n=1 Tax=Marasmius crinis-equi TaxID=585013 RepID=A0ABR3EK53_9AGAR
MQIDESQPHTTVQPDYPSSPDASQASPEALGFAIPYSTCSPPPSSPCPSSTCSPSSASNGSGPVDTKNRGLNVDHIGAVIEGEQQPPADEEEKPTKSIHAVLPEMGTSFGYDDEHHIPIRSGYSKASMVERVEQLLSTTTDFSEISGFRHYCDRTMMFHVTSAMKCVLLRTPPGYGKTTTLSMVEHFYDILRKDEFRRHFEHFAIGYPTIHQEEDWEHSHCFVLKLDFGELAVDEPGFNFHAALSASLRAFVKRYESFIPSLACEPFEMDSAGDTLDIIVSRFEYTSRMVVLIDNYDTPYEIMDEMDISVSEYRRLYEQLSTFGAALARWNKRDRIPLIMLAGRSNFVDHLSARLARLVYDVVRESSIDINAVPEDMLGLTQHETKLIGYRLNDDFHSLGLARIGQEYLESEEGKEYWERVGGYYGLSFVEILDLYAYELEKACEKAEENVPPKPIPIDIHRR